MNLALGVVLRSKWVTELSIVKIIYFELSTQKLLGSGENKVKVERRVRTTQKKHKDHWT